MYRFILNDEIIYEYDSSLHWQHFNQKMKKEINLVIEKANYITWCKGEGSYFNDVDLKCFIYGSENGMIYNKGYINTSNSTIVITEYFISGSL